VAPLRNGHGVSGEKATAIAGNAPDLLATPLGLDAWRSRINGADYALLTFPVGREDLWRGLTPRERAVATEVLRGLSNAGIARKLGVSPRTVANQVAAIFRKLGVGSRAELAAYSLEHFRPRRAGS
jgi:DNA-binding CsgD family transcriptional regulator